MADEADFSITKWFGDKEDEWQTFRINDAAADIVARIVTRATIGIDFASFGGRRGLVKGSTL